MSPAAVRTDQICGHHYRAYGVSSGYGLPCSQDTPLKSGSLGVIRPNPWERILLTSGEVLPLLFPKPLKYSFTLSPFPTPGLQKPGVGFVVRVVAWDPRVLSSSPVGHRI